MIIYIYIVPLQCCPFILYLDVILHCHLLFAQTLFLVFSVIVDMIEMNYLHFYLCMAVFVSPSCLKDSFNLLTDFFFLQHFEFVIPPPSNFQFANEESTINHAAIPHQVFSLAAFTIFSALISSLLNCSVVYKCILCFLTESP